MSIKKIEAELNKRFSDCNEFSKRNIIFWYDKDGQYEKEINNLHLINAKLQRLSKDNSIYTKYLIEHEDKETNYLIYAPFERPDDTQNHLADMFYYSRFFTTDKATAICEECKLSKNFIPFLKKYQKIFNESTENLFKNYTLQIDVASISEQKIGLILIASLLKDVNIQPNLNEIVKVLITDKLKDNIPIKFANIEKSGLDTLFWKYCETEYGYISESKDFQKFKAALLITHSSIQINESYPSSYNPYILSKPSNVVLLISNIITNIELQDKFISMSNEVQDRFKIPDLIDKFSIDNCLDCYTFECIDKKIISHFINQLLENKYCLSHEEMAIIENRIKKTCFKNNIPLYKIINRASKLLNSIEIFEKDLSSSYNVEEIINNYTSKWNNIDRYYRQFYTYYDGQEFDNLETLFNELKIFIENIYTNNYLSKISLLWTDKIEILKSYNDIPGRKQWTFYDSVANVSAYSNPTIVIISDAFRYECAVQLEKELKVLPGYNTTLNYMVSTIPSYTQLGMAALLPFKNPQLENNGFVSLDGRATNGTDFRNAILTTADYKEQALCIQYDTLASKTKTEIARILSGKKLVYIYHNQIDARGDKAQSENEVFKACNEAITEIKNIINKISTSRSCKFKKFIITADHGFIYKRDKLVSSDKVSTGHINQNDIKNKRYVYTKDKTKIEGAMKFNMSYLDENLKDIDVIVPRGVDIFSFPGGGQNFVHGGASLQEIIIPHLTIETVKDNSKNNQEATIDLVSSFRVISNLNTYLEFIQPEPISNTIISRTVKAWFEDESGKKVSDIRVITIDRTNSNPEERKYHEKFTFGNQKYNAKDNYILKIVDSETNIDLKTYSYTIDIPFADDFGFGF